MYTVYIDLDDTLLDGKKRISAYTRDRLLEFQNRGNHIIFATARSGQLHGLQEDIKRITPYYIFHNGGEIVCHGNTVYQNFFSAEEVRMIGAFLTDRQIRAAVILDDGYYANYDAPSVWGRINNFCRTSFSDAAFSAPKFSVLLDDAAQKGKLDELRNISQITYTDKASQAILAPLNTSKGEAVRFLQERWFSGGVSVFIGNDHNDLSGFEACEMKAAVANAERDLLERADIIIESNENEGVAHFLDSLMEQKR